MKIKKSIIIAILVVSVIGLAFVGSASAISGTGTSSDPYILSSTSDLALLSDSGYASYTGSGVYFELGADIDFNSGSFTPIGTSSYPFNGHFDGKNHVISNMYITSSSGYSGFFSRVSGGDISNIVFRDCTLMETGGSYSGMLFGSMVGASSCTISNIEIDRCCITSSNSQVGGIAGRGGLQYRTHIYSGCKVLSCVISGTQNVGGIIGYGSNGTSASHGTVNCTNCEVYNTYILSSTSQVGGIIGGGGKYGYANVDDCEVTNCTIYGNNYVGGIIGYVNSSYTSVNVTNPTISHNDIQGSSYVGGAIGYQ